MVREGRRFRGVCRWGSFYLRIFKVFLICYLGVERRFYVRGGVGVVLYFKLSLFRVRYLCLNFIIEFCFLFGLDNFFVLLVFGRFELWLFM